MAMVNRKKINIMRPIKDFFRLFGDSDWFVGWLFVAPFLILWGYWFFIPFIESFMRSFQEVNFINLDEAKFIGIQNYINVIKDPDFHKAILHSLTIVAFAVPIQTFLALIIATALNQKIMGKGLFRTIYSIPYITSPIAIATVFMVLFRKDQIMTYFFTLFGFPNETWFANMKLALPFVIMMFVWQQIGFFMIIYLAGLQGIPKDLYEAGIVDGASAFQIFTRITIPMLKPVTFFIVAVGTIQAFQIYDQVAAISRYGNLGAPAGATSTVITYFYQHGIRYMNIGHGSSSVIIFFIIIISVTYLQRHFLEEKEKL